MGTNNFHETRDFILYDIVKYLFNTQLFEENKQYIAFSLMNESKNRTN